MSRDLIQENDDKSFSLSTVPSRINTNNAFIMKALCCHGHGIARMLRLNAQNELKTQELLQILPDWQLPEYKFYAITHKYEILPTKIKRCLELIKEHFERLASGSV